VLIDHGRYGVFDNTVTPRCGEGSVGHGRADMGSGRCNPRLRIIYRSKSKLPQGLGRVSQQTTARRTASPSSGRRGIGKWDGLRIPRGDIKMTNVRVVFAGSEESKAKQGGWSSIMT
jgi:hypothetical protein